MFCHAFVDWDCFCNITCLEIAGLSPCFVSLLLDRSCIIKSKLCLFIALNALQVPPLHFWERSVPWPAPWQWRRVFQSIITAR